MHTLKLGKKKQKEFKSLILMLKVMHLVVGTPLAVHRITGLQATSSCKKTMQIQRLAIEILREVIEEEQNNKLAIGVPQEGKRHTLLSQPCVEENTCLLSKPCVEENMCLLSKSCVEESTCDLLKDGFSYKQQCELQAEEVLEIYESDDIAYETLLESEGEEHEDLFCALVEETKMSHPTYQDMMGHENIAFTSHKIEESNHACTIDQEDMYYPLKYHNFDEDQSSMHGDEDQSGRQGDEDLGDCKLSSGNMEGEDVLLESSYFLPNTIINWMSSYVFCCFSTTNTIESSHMMN
jgi:hypothetical protein